MNRGTGALVVASIACIAACQVPVRLGVSAPTREGVGGGAFQGTTGVTAVADLGEARIGGGPILEIVTSNEIKLATGGAQLQADIVLHRLDSDRQVVLATRLSGGGGSKGSSFGAFIGPALAMRGERASPDTTWHHLALGFTAQNVTFQGESAWFLGGAFEVAYAIDWERFMNIGRE